ncbi:MAG: hypothetical protein ACI9Y1_002425 [Lentisphaeria bacterium]
MIEKTTILMRLSSTRKCIFLAISQGYLYYSWLKTNTGERLMKIIVTFLVNVIFTTTVWAQVEGVGYSWELKRDKSDIKVFVSHVDGSKFKAVRAEMTVDASLNSLIGLVSDSAACPQWADLCKEERVIEQLSATESYVYTYNDIPFPVTDRDVLAHVVWRYDPEKQKVSMTSTAITGRLEKTRAVRIEKAIAHWHFTQLESGRVLVENFAHINPNGPTPAWVTNMLLVDSPYKTLKSMRKLIASGKYNDYQADFL